MFEDNLKQDIWNDMLDGNYCEFGVISVLGSKLRWLGWEFVSCYYGYCFHYTLYHWNGTKNIWTGICV